MRKLTLIALIVVLLSFLTGCGFICQLFPDLCEVPKPEKPRGSPVESEKIVTDPETGTKYASDQVIVVFKEHVGKNYIKTTISNEKSEIIGKIPTIKAYQVKIPSGKSASRMVSVFKQKQGVETASLNVILQLPESDAKSTDSKPRYIGPETDDPQFGQQDYLSVIRAEEAWKITKGTEAVKICLIDSGLDEEVKDLAVKTDQGYNAFTGGNDTSPSPKFHLNYHGTAVAGVAAAQPDNRKGLAGLAWKNRIIPIKAFYKGAHLGIPYFLLNVGIAAALRKDCKVINVNLAVPSWLVDIAIMKELIEIAQKKNRLLVAATSDSPPLGVVYPANFAPDYDNILAVAVTHNGKYAMGYGAEITIGAPGKSIYSFDAVWTGQAWMGGIFGSWTGTCLATPQVSGTAALIWSLDYQDDQDYDLSPAEVREIIEESADKVGSDKLGAGRLNAYRALTLAASPKYLGIFGIKSVDIALYHNGWETDIRTPKPAKLTIYIYNKDENLVHTRSSKNYPTWYNASFGGYIPDGEDGYVRIKAESKQGKTDFWPAKNDKYKLKRPEGITPRLIDDFTASDKEDKQSTLNWTNPPDKDLVRVMVRRKKGSTAPIDHTDGKLIYDDNSPKPVAEVSYTDDKELTNGITYYYAVFSKNQAGNWNDVADPFYSGKEGNADTAIPGPPTQAKATTELNEQFELPYKISGGIKTANVDGNVVIGLDYVKSDGWTPADGYVEEIGHVSGTTDWTYYESDPFTLPPMPEDTSALWFLLDFNAGKGKAWWDDLSLVEVAQ